MLHTKSTKELIIMRIKTNELDIIFSSLIPRKAADFEQKKNYKDGEADGIKTTDDGRAIYRTDLQALVLDDNGNPTRVDTNISLAVIEPTDIAPATPYRAAGTITVSPFLRNGRISYSITAEKIVPVANK
jgi:hypothetical protein